MFHPDGKESWCGWKQVQGGVKEHHSVIPEAVAKVIKPVYVQLAAFLAAAHFNNSAITELAVLREAGCEEGDFTRQHLIREDSERVSKSQNKVTEVKKRRNKTQRRYRKGQEERILALPMSGEDSNGDESIEVH